MNKYRQDEMLKDLKNRMQVIVPFGKLPPQSLDMEEAVLGALLIEKNAIHTVLSIIEPEDFYRNEHQLIYSAILELFREKTEIDILTVTNKLRTKGQLESVGGVMTLTALTNPVLGSVNIEYHAIIVREKAIARELILIFQETERLAYSEEADALELLSNAQSRLVQIQQRNAKGTRRPIQEIADKELHRIETLSKNPEIKVIGTSTGLDALDRILGGLEGGDLVIIAGRPGMGKTSLALCIAKSIGITQKKPVAIFSLEVSSPRLMSALFSIESGLDNNTLKTGQLKGREEWDALAQAHNLIAFSKIEIDDTPGLTYVELRSRCLTLKSERPDLALIVIDYLQLMTGIRGNGKSREQEISDISRNLKLIAKETDVPIIALSQLSRQVEQRGGAKRPILSDLRESGSIEQDADAVVFVFRPEYYGVTEDGNNKDLRGVAELIVSKNRHGATDTAVVSFHGPTTTFKDLNYLQSLTPF